MYLYNFFVKLFAIAVSGLVICYLQKNSSKLNNKMNLISMNSSCIVLLIIVVSTIADDIKWSGKYQIIIG